MPRWWASRRQDQRVAPSRGEVAWRMRARRRGASFVAGRPGRRVSSPAVPRARNRSFHLETVGLATLRVWATVRYEQPPANSSTIRARSPTLPGRDDDSERASRSDRYAAVTPRR